MKKQSRKKNYKNKLVFSLFQIPLIAAFIAISVICMSLFSESRTAHYEATGSQISFVAKKATNNQLTADFYPYLKEDEKDKTYLYKLITETKQFNHTNYSYYRGNAHKIRVIANGEGRQDYRFPDLEYNPTFILENTFSASWDDDHLYENYALRILNTKPIFNEKKIKHIFLNETDALYLIEHNERFKGLSLEDIPGKTIPLFYTQNGVEYSEDWTIANIIMANQLDDNLYKALYKSYVIADYNIPLLNNCYCIAFDFSSSDIDNSKYLSQLVSMFNEYDLQFDKRNLLDDFDKQLNNIKSEFYSLNANNTNETKIFIIVLIVGSLFLFTVFAWCSLVKVPCLSTCLLLFISFFLIYFVFLIFSKYFIINFFVFSFGTLSIVSLLLLFYYSIAAVLIASYSSDTPNLSLYFSSKKKGLTK